MYYYQFAVRLYRSIFHSFQYGFQNQTFVFRVDFWMANLNLTLENVYVSLRSVGRQQGALGTAVCIQSLSFTAFIVWEVSI